MFKKEICSQVGNGNACPQNNIYKEKNKSGMNRRAQRAQAQRQIPHAKDCRIVENRSRCFQLNLDMQVVNLCIYMMIFYDSHLYSTLHLDGVCPKHIRPYFFGTMNGRKERLPCMVGESKTGNALRGIAVKYG